MTLAETTEVLRGAHSRNLKTVRLHSGEPSIYGAIAEQMRALDKFAIPYAQVPGISSFQAAAAALCVELTIPELSQTVVLTRSPGRTPMPGEAEWWQGFHRHATYCLFLSVNKLNDLAPKLAERMGADCPCAVVYHASRPDQIVLRGTLETIAEKVSKTTIHSTAQVLIGYALGANEYAVSRLYADSFNHGFREAKTDAC